MTVRFVPNSHFAADFQLETRKFLIQAAAKTATFAAKRCKVGTSETGHVHTRDTIRATVEGTGTASYGQVTAGGAAVYLEFGTAAHPIDPLHPKEALWWPGADHPVSHVDHPGTPPRPFLRPALLSLATWINGGGQE